MRPFPARVAPRRTRWLSAIALVMLLLLAACAAGSSGVAPQPAEGTSAGGRNLAGQPATGDDAFGGGKSGEQPSTPPDADLVDAERHIIKTGEISLEVADVGVTLAKVRATALQLGGYVGGSQAGTVDDRATLTLRIPAARFDDALAALHELDAKVLVEATREEDVTGSIVDLRARIDNLQASEQQYRALLNRAQRIEDILSVQSRLDDVRGQIEQLSGQLKSISNQADLATLTVSLVPRAEPVQQASTGWDPGKTASEALAALVEIGQGLASVLIWFAVVWLPVLLVLAIIALVVLRGLFEVRRRLPAAPASPSAPTDPAS